MSMLLRIASKAPLVAIRSSSRSFSTNANKGDAKPIVNSTVSSSTSNASDTTAAAAASKVGRTDNVPTKTVNTSASKSEEVGDYEEGDYEYDNSPLPQNDQQEIDSVLSAVKSFTSAKSAQQFRKEQAEKDAAARKTPPQTTPINLHATEEKKPFKPSAQRTIDEDLEIVKTKMTFDNVGTRYAFLLWSSYKNDKKLGTLQADVDALYKEYDKGEEFARLIDDALVAKSVRHQRLLKFLETKKFSENMDAFLHIVSVNGRLGSLQGILADLETIREKIERDISVATVVSAQPLNSKDREDIKSLIASKFRPQGKLEMIEKVDESLGGGYELFYDDKFHLDNSQKARAEELSKQIKGAVSTYFSTKEDQERRELEKARITG